MTNKHVKWCLSHDWCQDAVLNADGSIDVSTADNVAERFKTFAELKSWAGY